MSPESKKSVAGVTIQTRARTNSTDSSSAPSVRTPRAARFAEATAVYSPIEPSEASKSPFAKLSSSEKPKAQQAAQPSDVGFGYISQNEGRSQIRNTLTVDDARNLPPSTPKSPLKSPLKSALKSPGAPPRVIENPLSPTFKEEEQLEVQEKTTEKKQAKDLKAKIRVRMAKVFLRGINFSCSLIVLAMVAATFSIFNATKAIPPRNNLPPWAKDTPVWPQITILVIASISLFMAVGVFYAWWRGGHKRAEKVAVYYTTFAVAFFIFSIIMWGIGAGILNQSRENGDGQDMWGWSCKDNQRRELFKDDVSYDLICRLQDWALICCIIEIVVETLTISLYAVVFYRYWSKRKLRKSMASRDKARSDLYLSQLRSQSVPNTPGFGPLSPRDGGWRPPPGHPSYRDPLSAAENGASTTSVVIDKEIQSGADADNDATVQYPRGFAAPKPFTLQAPPIRIQGATPKLSQSGFSSPITDQAHAPLPYPFASSTSPPTSPSYFNTANRTTGPMSPGFLVPEKVQEHVPAAPGEQQYASVPIPDAYASPVASPSFAPQQMTMPVPGAQLRSPSYAAPATTTLFATPDASQHQRQQHYSGFDFGDAVRRNS